MQAFSPAVILALAVFFGSAMDATIKHLAETNHVLIVALGRYVFGALFALPTYWHAGRPPISAEMWRIHGARGLLVACSGTAFFWAFTILPLAEAITLSFVGVLLIPPAARLMLGERLRPSSALAALLGFAGVIVAAQGAPSSAEAPQHAWGVAAVLAAAALFAVAMTLTRARAVRDGTAIVALLSSLTPALFVVAPAIVMAPPPLLSDWPVFLLMGAFAAAFMHLMAHAYAHAEAQQLAPMHYTELIWATAFGYFIFAEAPRLQIYLGAALIIAAGLFATYDERRIARKLKDAP
jgi:S-adenosylmethionine uptake transporter